MIRVTEVSYTRNLISMDNNKKSGLKVGTITSRSQRIFRPGQGLLRSRSYDKILR